MRTDSATPNGNELETITADEDIGNTKVFGAAEGHPVTRSKIEPRSIQGKTPGPDTLRVGLIDSFRFSQECLQKALDGLHPRPEVHAFFTPDECIDSPRTDFDLLLYHAHAGTASERDILQGFARLKEEFKNIPLIILSDGGDTQLSGSFYDILGHGAQGLICTRTTGIPVTLAAIRFIKEGGIFVPPDLLVAHRVGKEPDLSPPARLTPRQLAVLSQLQQGNSNKVIAHALQMSENTVKAHVRNIMRKVGATNRTQAAFKGQKHVA